MPGHRMLFLDDMATRARTFSKYVIGHVVDYAETAARAIELLQTNTYRYVFLDHDLSLDDIMCEPGKGSVPTGMDVVDHIVSMQVPPAEIVVHTCNDPAGREMCNRLNAHPNPSGLVVHRLPFPALIQLLARTEL